MLFLLNEIPEKFVGNYFSRKIIYAINGMIVCDDQGQYLLADSAYVDSDILVTPFRRSTEHSLTSTVGRFNYLHANQRIAVEHSIGMLKGRFQSLKGLRTRLTDKNLSKS